ncbi:hypothetical protein F2Q70_00020700 [Brassica cretica]|uniref:Zinc knuckle CX2CX4HX4C domain-containing protein n=1 Tax=Brassica cretica TaxID=69181 RepID=A0A8S9GHC1_BRACR|nr:hypothetical protein F2Q70_00020700 [Brassica cretica]
MGKVGLVELHAKNSNSLEYVRAQVSINTEEPLQFRRTARFRSGATIPTELEYEKLLKVCYTYKRLTHDQSRCPLQSNTSQELVKGGQAKSKEQNLRHKLLEKELKAKEVLQKSSGKGVVIRSSQTGEIQRGGRNKSSENREDKRKGKRVASSPQMVWKQKDGRGATKTSRSTGESTANQISSGEKNEQRSIMEKSKGSRDLAELKEAGSAFKRLGSSEKSGSGGSRG